MSPGGPPADYVDVAERIREFKAQYPDGSLQTAAEPKMFSAGDKAFIAYSAYAYRTPDDPRPGQGWAWEPVPGPTPFTKDSELMNAETSAWGRAIVALGFQTKQVASAEEVRNRQDFVPPEPQPEKPAPASEKPVTPGVLAELSTMLKLLTGAFPEHPGQGRTWADVAKEHAGKGATELTLAEANQLLRWLEDQYNEATKANEVPFG
jgi:hypothetical protein